MFSSASSNLLRAGRVAAGRRMGTVSATTSGARSQSTRGGPGIPSGVLSNWYSVFGKSNIAYITWVVAGILVAETFTGGMTDMLWASANKGRTYDSIDWKNWIVPEEDDDEDEEDEDEDEGDDDDDDDE